MSGKKKRIGLILSGGGTRSFAQFGVLKVLEENGIKPDIVVGVSAGALVGASLASGKKVQESIDYFLSLGMRSFVKPQLKGKGLLRSDHIAKKLIKYIEKTRFRDLDITFRTAATDINTGKIKRLDKGDLLPALSTTISFPGIFSPKQIDDGLYIDGGLTHSVPFHLLDKVDLAIVVNVAVIPHNITPRNSNMKRVLENCVVLLQKQLLKLDIENFEVHTPVIYIQPKVDEFDWFEYKKSRLRELVSIGEQAAKKALKQAFKDHKL